MGVTYPADTTFASLPMTGFRDLLRAYATGKGVAQAAALRNVDLDPLDAAVAMDEALSQGLVAERDAPDFADPGTPLGKALKEWDTGRNLLRLTPAGMSVAVASRSKPITDAQADAVLAAFLGNAADLNGRRDMPYAVEQVWLYGSHARGAAHVNDVDVAVATSRTAAWAVDGAQAGLLVEVARDLHGGKTLPGFGPEIIRALFYLEARLVYGPRRHPRLAPTTVLTGTRAAATPHARTPSRDHDSTRAPEGRRGTSRCRTPSPDSSLAPC